MECLESFVNYNSKIWSKVPTLPQKVLVEGNFSLFDVPRKSIVARIIHQTLNCEPIVLMNNKKNISNRKIFESFGIANFIYIDHTLISNPLILIKSIAKTIKEGGRLLLKRHYYDDFISNFHVNGVEIGENVYDFFIRNNHCYKNPRNFKLHFLKILFKALLYFYTCDFLIKKHDIACVLVNDWYYPEIGLPLARIAARKGLPVFCSFFSITTNRNYTRRLGSSKDVFRSPLHPPKDFFQISEKYQCEILTTVDKYLKKRFKGETLYIDAVDAFKDKAQCSRDELCRALSLDMNKKIVFIMPHAFSDANHVYKKLLFRDFHQWFIETINFISKIRNVNWIIKPHPCSYLYQEDRHYIQSIIEEHNAPFLKLAPENFSTSSVFDIADTLVTVNGTAGLEGACMGLKPVLAGKAVYSDIGLSYDPKTQSEYFEILSTLDQVERLDELMVAKAKRLLYWYHIALYPESEIIPSVGLVQGERAEDMLQKYDIFFYELTRNLNSLPWNEDPYVKAVTKIVEGNELYFFDDKSFHYPD